MSQFACAILNCPRTQPPGSDPRTIGWVYVPYVVAAPWSGWYCPDHAKHLAFVYRRETVSTAATTAQLQVTGSLKMLRETLCRAQNNIANRPLDQAAIPTDLYAVQELINEIDRHRPLGPDGKHGNLHTQTCGCEDQQ